MLYKEANQSCVNKEWKPKVGFSHGKEINSNCATTKEFCQLLKRDYDKLKLEEKSKYETLSQDKYNEYLVKYQEVEFKAEQLQLSIDLIIAQGRFDIAAKRKKVSAYRVFKKEIAEKIKDEFPKMNNSERQMIVKERWKGLSDREKGIFVFHSRYLEEKKLFLGI